MVKKSIRFLGVLNYSVVFFCAVVIFCLGVPLLSKAFSLDSGSLIKSSTPAVYYYGADGKRYVFPNEKTYKTWYSDFSSVKTVSEQVLAQIPIGGNIVYRPGTRLVKITTDPKVYAVEPGGVLRHLDSENVAKGLYGPNWYNRVDDLPDAFFTDYSLGSVLDTVTPPLGSVVAEGGESFFINKQGQKCLLEKPALAANLINSNYVLNVNPSLLNDFSSGEVIKDLDWRLRDTSQASLVLASNRSSGKVEIFISGRTPQSGDAIPAGTDAAPLLCFEIVNGTVEDVKLSGLSFNAKGVFPNSDIEGVFITDEFGRVHGDKIDFDDKHAVSSFSSDPVMIDGNTKRNVCVNVDLVANAVNSTLGLQVDGAADFIITSNGNTLAPLGSFPMSGPLVNVVEGLGRLGQLQVTCNTVSGGTPGNEILVSQGEKNLDISEFLFTEKTGNEDVELMGLSLQNNGTLSGIEVENIRLLGADKRVLSSVGIMNNNEVFLGINLLGTDYANVGPQGGLLIKAGSSQNLIIRIDTKASAGAANRTINFVIRDSVDVRAVGVQTNSGVDVIDGGVGALAKDQFPVGGDYNILGVQTGSVSLTVAAESFSGKVIRGTQALDLAIFNVVAFDEDVELQAIEYSVVKDLAGSGLSVGDYVLNGVLKIKNKAGDIIYSQTGVDGNHYGTGNHTIVNGQIAGVDANGMGTLKYLNTYYEIPAGTSGKIIFTADIPQRAIASDSFAIKITGYKIKRISSGTFETVTSGINVVSNKITVDSSDLQMIRHEAFNPITFVPGGPYQPIGAFTLQSGSEAWNVEGIRIRICGSNTGVIDLAACNTTVAADLGAISSVLIKSGEDFIVAPFSVTSTAGTNVLLPPLVIPAQETGSFEVWAQIGTGWTSFFTGVGAMITSASGYDSGIVLTSGEVYGIGVAGWPGAEILVEPITSDVNFPKVLRSSQEDVSVYEFQVFNNSAQFITLKKLYLGVSGGSGVFSAYKLFANGEQIGSTGVFNNGEVRFNNLDLFVYISDYQRLVVKASLLSSVNLNAGVQVKMGVTHMDYSGDFTGERVFQSGGVAIAADIASDVVSVNDLVSFKQGDPVYVDWNNDGDFSDNHVGDNVNETTVYYVCNLANGGIKLGMAANCAAFLDITGINSFASGGRLTRFPLSSSVAYIEEVEPVISRFDYSQNGVMGTDSQVAAFRFKNEVNRPLYLHNLNIEITGSYQINGTNSHFGPRNFSLWRASEVDGVKTVAVSGGPELKYVPSVLYDNQTADSGGVLGNHTLVAAAASLGDDSFIVVNGLRNIHNGSRISFRDTNGGAGTCSDAVKIGNSNVGYRVKYLNGSFVNISPALKGGLGIGDVVCPFYGVQETISTVNSLNSIITSVGVNTSLTVGDGLVFFKRALAGVQTNSDNGFFITDIDSSTGEITFWPALPPAHGLVFNDIVRSDGNVLSPSVILESGALIRFNFPSGEQVISSQDNIYAITADTSKMKNPATGFNSSLGLRIPGTIGSQIGAGLYWSYTLSRGGQRGILAYSDYYPVIGSLNKY